MKHHRMKGNVRSGQKHRATDGKNGIKAKSHAGSHKGRHHDGVKGDGRSPKHVGNKAMGKRLRGLEGRLESKPI